MSFPSLGRPYEWITNETRDFPVEGVLTELTGRELVQEVASSIVDVQQQFNCKALISGYLMKRFCFYCIL
jgi:hypothetical protein